MGNPEKKPEEEKVLSLPRYRWSRYSMVPLIGTEAPGNGLPAVVYLKEDDVCERLDALSNEIIHYKEQRDLDVASMRERAACCVDACVERDPTLEILAKAIRDL